MTSRLLRIGAVALVLAAWRPPAMHAQESPYVPLDDIAYAYIDALRARGELGALSMLERPYTVRDVRRALEASAAIDRGRVIASWRSAVRRAIDRYDPWAEICAAACAPDSAEGLALTASAGLFVTGRTSGLRELMLADDVDGVYPGGMARVAARGGPFVAGIRVIADRGYRDDPEYAGKKDRAIAGRMEDAYLGVSLPYLEATAGRVARNLGPAPLTGLQIGSYAYTYDHLFLRLGTRRFHLSTMVASLDPMRIGTDSVAQRYLAMHRLSGRWGGLEVAIAEAMLFGGVDRRFDPGFLNPLNIYQLTQYNERADGNVSYSLEAAWQAGRFGTFAAQLLIDDFQVDECTPNCDEPTSYGLTVAAEGLPLIGAQRWFASYARVSNLAYRTPARFEQYSVYGVGLGHGFSDYDEVRAGVDLALLPGLTLRPYASLRRQGEGDYRGGFPAPSEYAETPSIHAGVVERTTRAAVQGRLLVGDWVRLSGDVGYNQHRDRAHVPGATRSGVEGAMTVSLETPAVFTRLSSGMR